jgi:energy-coupling factor transporter ATP-binding protein EcfA2
VTLQIDDLEKWFQERHKWLQDAARRLIQNGDLADQDYSDLLTICKAEAEGQGVTFTGIVPGSLGVQDATNPLRLDSIANIQGVNALSPTKPLSFGTTPLCIVYGRNGAGKSGYIRLLKHACGARRPGNLLGNIFNSAPQPKSADFTYSDTQTKTSTWSGPPLPELKGVDIYDTECGLVYVNEENEVAFEPWLLRLFTKLTLACEAVSGRLDAQIQLLVSTKPQFPPELATTSPGQWYENLTSATPPAEVDQHTAWIAENDTELDDLNRRLAESNPLQKAAILRRQKADAVELAEDLKAQCEGLSSEKCEAYLQSKADSKAKRITADEDAKKVFEEAPLDGIGSDSWRQLWDAARTYSENVVYTGVSFPDLGADSRCVLCQRQLDPESRERFQSFEEFVKGELQSQAIQAEETYRTLEKALPGVLESATLILKMDAAGLSDLTARGELEKLIAELSKHKAECLAAQNAADMSPLTVAPAWELLVSLSEIHEAQAVACEEDAKGLNRPQLEARQKELLANKWLNQQRQSVDSEIARLEQIRKLRAAQDLTNTHALSRRKTVLAEELITNAYVDRFKEELAHLRATRLHVEIKKTRTEVGRVFHRVVLCNAAQEVRTSDILSEGEFRIASLAAFLADTGGRGAQTPFIFDDPISSLDQVYEEATAQRLAALSKSRQVIIFTHRLSLVSMLEKYSDKDKVTSTIVCLSRIRTGDISDLPITLTKTKPAANRLLNEGVAAARKALGAGDAAYEQAAKALCRDIRILMEQVVESDLIFGVVRRYSAEVQTKNRIEHLAKITPEDCGFIDEMMTEYSRYEHSQPDEAPVELPKPDEIEGHLKRILAFIEAVQKRNK